MMHKQKKLHGKFPEGGDHENRGIFPLRIIYHCAKNAVSKYIAI